MQLIGNNDKLGDAKVRISGDRVAKPVQDKTEPFPRGVRGLVPISTTLKGGGTQTYYVFKDKADLETLEAAVRVVNELMADAEELAECRFGAFEEVRVGLKSPGDQFCRAEYFPVDKRGFATPNPVTLHIESEGTPREPGYRTAVVEYDRDGNISRIAADTFRVDEYSYRLTAMPEEGELVVHKIETATNKGKTRLLYKSR